MVPKAAKDFLPAWQGSKGRDGGKLEARRANGRREKGTRSLQSSFAFITPLPSPSNVSLVSPF